MAQAKEKPNLLDALVAGDPRGVIALMLWKNRLREPDMYVQITEPDILGFQASCQFQKLVPQVLIRRPEGLQAQAAIPAVGNRRAVPARAATPPKPYVIVTLVEKDTENVIRPIENNEADYDLAQDAAKLRKAKDDAPRLAQRLLDMAHKGEFSLSEIQDAANILTTLARVA